MIRSLSTFLIACLVTISVFAQDAVNDFSQNLRPQFHFTSPENYIGSPAAVLYADSLYHLFYEYSPVGNTPVYLNMGHAVSRDLLHWTILPLALQPDDGTRDLNRCTIRSGSALLDTKNILSKQQSDTLTMVIFYTSFECGIRMAFSTDGGNVWTKYGDQPLIPYVEAENARDPKVFWYEPTGKYVMILSCDPKGDEAGEGFSFYTSDDLKDWTFQSHVVGLKGKPDLFELPVNRRPDDKRWVLTDSEGSYVIGQFDGTSFTAETSLLKSDYGFYSGPLSWPVGEGANKRVLQLASLSGTELPGMPFAGQFSFPAELRIQNYVEGLRLVKEPAAEVTNLHEKEITIENKNIIPGLDKNPMKRFKGDRFHFVGTFRLKTVSSFGFVMRNGRGDEGTEIRYDATRNQLSCLGKSAELMPEDGKIKLDILVDRSSIEIYANDGKVAISGQFVPHPDASGYILYNTGGELYIEKLNVYPLKSVYNEK